LQRASMKVLVVRQPWAWLIVNGYKDIENRSWGTRFRGLLIIQASAARHPQWRLDAIRLWVGKRGVELPANFDQGGIVGCGQLVDCVTKSASKWFEGPVGWVLAKPRRLPFIRLKGKLGLFAPPPRVLKLLPRAARRPRSRA